eukprot:superscaffoldBa00005111_g19907
MCADNRNGECPMHGPLHSLRRLVGTSSTPAPVTLPDVPDWLRDLPRERIPQGTWIGPFQGVPLLVDKHQSGAVRNTRHLWEVSGTDEQQSREMLSVCVLMCILILTSLKPCSDWMYASAGAESSRVPLWGLEPAFEAFRPGEMLIRSPGSNHRQFIGCRA